MKILFIAQVASIHTARWVNQLHGTGWDYRIFQPVPSASGVRGEHKGGHLYLPYPVSMPANLSVEYTLTEPPRGWSARARWRAWKIFWRALHFCVRAGQEGLKLIGIRPESSLPVAVLLAQLLRRAKQGPKSSTPDAVHAAYLARIIREWKPDLIHSLGMFVNWRDNSRIFFQARRLLGEKLSCPWIVSTWGPDLDLYPHLGENERAQATAILSSCDGIVVEGDRDLKLAQQLGFCGRLLGKIPAFGGVTWKSEDLAPTGATSTRRVIVLKGRDNSDAVTEGGDPQGRAMTAMKAFEQCRNLLDKYSLVIVQATPAIEHQAKVLENNAGIKIQVHPNSTSLPHNEWLKLLGSARVLIAVTVSDGLPSTLVEAMSLGVFPIHSGLETVREWIRDGQNGLLIQAGDVDGVARALRTALTDDILVDSAAEHNARLVAQNFSDQAVRPMTIRLYQTIQDLRQRHEL